MSDIELINKMKEADKERAEKEKIKRRTKGCKSKCRISTLNRELYVCGKDKINGELFLCDDCLN